MAPVAVVAVSAGMALAAGVMKAKAAQQEGDAAAAVGQYNANIARQDAVIVESQTHADILKARNEHAKTQGSVVARSGILGGMTGSNLDIYADNAVQQELDILNIKQQGALKVRGLKNQAALDISAGENAKKQSKLAASGAILGGIGNAAGSFSGMAK